MQEARERIRNDTEIAASMICYRKRLESFGFYIQSECSYVILFSVNGN